MGRARTDTPIVAGLPLHHWRQIAGILHLALALGVFLALIGFFLDRHWIGAAGRDLAQALVFGFGDWIAYLPAAFFLIFGVQCFRDGPLSWRRPLFKFLSLVVLVCSSCALMTLFAAKQNVTPSVRFHYGGMIGAFLTSPEGLGIEPFLGPVGSALCFGCAFLISTLLMTELLLRDLFGKGASAIRGAAAYSASRMSFSRRLQGFESPAPAKTPAAAKSARGKAAPPVAPKTPRLAVGGRSLWNPLTWALWPFRAGIHTLIPRRESAFLRVGPPVPAKPKIIDRSGAIGLPTTPDEEPPPKFELRSEEPMFFGGRRNKAAKPVQDFLTAALNEKEAALFSEPLTGKTPPAQSGAGAGSAAASADGPDFGLDEGKDASGELEVFNTEYNIPPMDLLNPPKRAEHRVSESEILQTSARLEQTLRDYGVEAVVTQVVQGPVVTRFELQPAAGVKVNRIATLDRELAMALLAEHVRILAPIPGKAAVGVEIPNKKVNAVFLREILASAEFTSHASPLAFGLGKDISGEPIVCDLATMPHLLIAGATGAGKSVCINSIVISILMRMPPDQVKFVMIDPKRVELTNYQDIPHLLSPVVVNPRKAAGALAWAVDNMEMRYRLLEKMHVRNIGAYNEQVIHALDHGKRLPPGIDEPMPYIVVIVDELADLMIVARNEVEESIQRLAQMSRAVGIHLILATQRPSVNVITGVIKANFPARIAFRVSSKVDSRTIMDCNGAETLLGKGDMLWAPGGGKLYRVQGAFVSDGEVERVADMIREQGPPRYEKDDFAAMQKNKGGKGGRGSGSGGGSGGGSGESGLFDEDSFLDSQASAVVEDPINPDEMDDEAMYYRALKLILESKKASVSLIQRRLKIGYARAGRLMDMMEENGIVGPYQGSKPREMLIDPKEYMRNLREQGLIGGSGGFSDE